MKSSVGTIFLGVLSFFVLSGCGDDKKSSQVDPQTQTQPDPQTQTQEEPQTQANANELVAAAKPGSVCTQVEKNLLDWGAWQEADPSQLGNDPARGGTNCVQVDVDETDQAAVTALNAEITKLDQARTGNETLCKWVTSGGSNWVCKPPSDLTQIKSTFIARYVPYMNGYRCSSQQEATITSSDCIKMTEERSGSGNVQVVMTDTGFSTHINTARNASEFLCLRYIGINNVNTQFLCRTETE